MWSWAVGLGGNRAQTPLFSTFLVRNEQGARALVCFAPFWAGLLRCIRAPVVGTSVQAWATIIALMRAPKPPSDGAFVFWLSFAQLISWGSVFYGFSVFLEPTEQALGMSRAQSSLGFSLALLAEGLLAYPVGRLIDRGHERAVMTATLKDGWLIANMHSSFVPGWAHFLVWRAAHCARKEAKRQGLRLIFCGDLNLKSHWFLHLCGLSSLTHEPTFPAWQPDQHIDHICVERHDPAVAVSAEVMRFGVSDHCALVVEFQ